MELVFTTDPNAVPATDAEIAAAITDGLARGTLTPLAEVCARALAALDELA